jgi:GT2 family glycosyltransferase
MPDLTCVVILNFNGTPDTLDCLASLSASSNDKISILVVDNGSSADPTADILARFPSITILRLPDNQGWAGGNNRGIEWARAIGADLVCLLNNDTIIPLGAIEALADMSRQIGPCLLHPAIDYAEPAGAVQLDPTKSGNNISMIGHEGVYKLDFAYGACLMIPMALLDKIGAFDERFFLQLEETDFYRRAQRIGIDSLCMPAARIIHKESASFGRRTTPMKTYYMVRNSLLLSKKHDETWAERLASVRRLTWSLMAIANINSGNKLTSVWKLGIWLLRGNVHARAARHGISDFTRKKFGRMSE